MEKDTLALEILHELKSTIKRLWITVVILILLLFGTNLAWLYYWNLPEDVTTTSYEIQSEDNGNAVYNEDGGVTINGTNKSD